jgi:vacuolar protein sorting-associated protein 11
MEQFFRRSEFDVAYEFAKNQNADKSLLAEISRLHGDFYYQKQEFKKAIEQYNKTAGYVEPSYIIRQFLDVSHIEYLI